MARKVLHLIPTGNRRLTACGMDVLNWRGRRLRYTGKTKDVTCRKCRATEYYAKAASVQASLEKPDQAPRLV